MYVREDRRFVPVGPPIAYRPLFSLQRRSTLPFLRRRLREAQEHFNRHPEVREVTPHEEFPSTDRVRNNRVCSVATLKIAIGILILFVMYILCYYFLVENTIHLFTF